MNRFQREVEDLDRRYQFRVRIISSVIAACLIAAALWSADVPSRLISLGHGPTSTQHADHGTPISESVLDTSTDVSATLGTAGTESSASAKPLAIHLISTAPGRNASEGTARIGVSVENPQTYAAGAVLANGARLTAVYIDRVVLQREDESVTLYVQGEQRRGSHERESELLFVGGQRDDDAALPSTRNVLTDYLRPSPVFDGNQIVGFQVYSGRASGVFSQMGLQAGDLITSIDGAPLVDANQAMDLLQYVAEGGAVIATVSRNNSALQVSLDGALIVADRERTQQAIAHAGTMPAHPSR